MGGQNSILVAALIGLAVFIVSLVFFVFSNRNRYVKDQVNRLSPSFNSGGGNTNLDMNSAGDGAKTGMTQFLEGLLSALGVDVAKIRKETQMAWAQAGIYSQNSIIFYIFAQRVLCPILGAIFAIIFIVLLVSEDASTLMKMIYFGLMGASLLFATSGARVYLSNRKQKRQQKLQQSFPDALDLLLVCVESGLALDGALSRVCRELGAAHEEITLELNRTRLELTLLSDRVQALQNFGDRTDLVPVRSLVSALIQTERFGTSLSDTLRVLSEDYRLTRLMIAENKAGKLPALMMIPLIGLLLPSLMVIILGPPLIKVFSVGSQ